MKVLAKLFATKKDEVEEYVAGRNTQGKVSYEEVYNYHSLSDLLHYESYDDAHRIFINNGGYGFMLEVGLFVGSSSALERELDGLFKNILPENSSIQFLQLASNKVGSILTKWREERANKSRYEVISSLVAQREKFFRELGVESKVRDYRLYISYSKSGKPTEFNLKEASTIRSRIKTLLRAGSVSTRVCDPYDLISLSKLLFNYNHADIDEIKSDWNKYHHIRDQIIDRGSLFELNNKGLVRDQGKYEYRTYGVNIYPSKWGLGAMSSLIGDNFREWLSLRGFVVMHYGIYVDGSKVRRASLLAKGARVENQASTPLGKWIPALSKEAEEWRYVRSSFEQNERLIRTNYQILLIDQPEEIEISEQMLMTLYNSHGWQLGLDRFVTLPSFLSMLPMSWGSGMVEDMTYFRKNRTTLSYEAINLLPVQGEYKGSNTAGMLLTGRKGQLMYWYPFDNRSGNFNSIVVGRAGSGKSVFMQELATTLLGLGGRAYVLDIGRSFERQAKFLGGEFIEFNSKVPICINPFSSIDENDEENKNDSLSLLKHIISLMVAPKAGTDDYQDAVIERALFEVWDKFKSKATIDDLASHLLASQDEIAKKLGNMLFPYSKKGSYGKFFNGAANVNLNDNFIVIELEDLTAKQDLQGVVFQIFIVLMTNKILLGDRKTHTAVVFDEVWKLLEGKQGSKFIETLARTLRKCAGMLIMGTQNVNDFYSSASAEAAFNNSDWLCMLSQKKEAIELLKKNGRFADS